MNDSKMDTEKIIGSEKYDLHTIDDVILFSDDGSNKISLDISARDKDNRYIKRFTMSFYPEDNFGQAMLNFLAREGETTISLDDLRSRLIGSSYITLNIDKVESGPKVEGINYDESIKLSPDFVHEGFNNGNKGVNLEGRTELMEYSPTKPFRNFAEEKEFRRHYGRNRVLAWGGEKTYLYQIESDIREVVTTLNKLNFAYANWWSYSGTPKDHDGPSAKFARQEFTLDWLRNTSSVPAPDHAGYIIFRTDEQNPDYQRFKSEVNGIPGVKIDDTNDRYKNKILLVTVDDVIVHQGQISTYQRHLETKWGQVLSVMQKYLAKAQFSK